MLSVDGLSEKYSRLAADGSAQAKEKEAYQLIVTAEKQLDEEQDEQGYETALKAIESFKALKKKAGIADATRIAVHVNIFWEKRKEAAQMAKNQLADFEASGDKLEKAKMLLSLAECNADRRGNAKREESLEQAAQAREIFQAEGEKKMEANALITLAAANLKTKGDKMEGALTAVDYASEALKLSRSIGDKRGEATALHAFAVSTIQIALLEPSMCLRMLWSDSTFEDGLDAAKAALDMWNTLGCTRAAAYEHQCIAQWQLVSGQVDEARQDAQKAVQDAGKGHKASAASMLVQAHLAAGEEDQALEVAKKALEDAQNSGNKYDEAIAFDCLVMAYKGAKKWDEALQAAEESLELIRDRDDLINEARAQNQIITINLERKDISAAMEAADEMLRLNEEIGNPQTEAFARQRVGEIYIQKGEGKKAMQQYKAMQKLFKDAGDEKGQAMALIDVCNACITEGKYDDAVTSATEAQSIYKTHGDKTGESDALKLLSQLAQWMDDAEATLKAAARNKSLLRSIGDKRGEANAAMMVAHARLWVLSKSDLARDTKEFHEMWCRAEREARDSMAIAYGLQDIELISAAHYMLAQVYVATDGMGEEALAEALSAASMYKEAGDTKGEASAQVVVAHGNFLSGKTDKAMEAAQEALQIFQQIGDEAGQQMTLRAMQQFMGPVMGGAPGGGGMPMDFPDFSDGGAAAQQGHAPSAGQVAAAGAPVLSHEVIVDKITTMVQNITQIDDDLPADLPLMQAGLTSNATVLLRNQLAEAFPDTHFPFTLAFDYPSISAVADFVQDS